MDPHGVFRTVFVVPCPPCAGGNHEAVQGCGCWQHQLELRSFLKGKPRTGITVLDRMFFIICCHVSVVLWQVQLNRSCTHENAMTIGLLVHFGSGKCQSTLGTGPRVYTYTTCKQTARMHRWPLKFAEFVVITVHQRLGYRMCELVTFIEATF